MVLNILLLLICIAGSALAEGSETALVSASRIRLQHLASQGLKSADRALSLLKSKERTLALILIVNNVFTISAGALATDTLLKWFAGLGPIIAVLVITSILLIAGQIVPKAYSRHHADRVLSLWAWFWHGARWVLLPAALPIHFLATGLFRLFGAEARALYTTREEIKLLLEESVEHGGLGAHQQEMLESALDYGTTIVREVMVPTSEVAILPETARIDELLSVVRAHGYTRIPVYRERVDQIVGFVNIYDVFFDRHPKTFIRTYIRSTQVVPETKRIDELFVEMQRRHEALAVVVNEFGACFGIVTIEDIIEEIFGELADEHEDTTPEIQKTAPGRYTVSGGTDVDDLHEETGIAIRKHGFETVGGYVLYRLGRIPKTGESFKDGDMTVRVVEADRYSVKTVEIRKHDSSAMPSPE